MTNVFISHSEIDSGIVNKIASDLNHRGYEVLSSRFEFGIDIKNSLENIIERANVFIVLITKRSLDSERLIHEWLQLLNYTSHSDKLLIPVIESGIDIDNLPSSIRRIQNINFESHSNSSIKEVVKNIDNAINQFLGKKLASDEKAKEIKDRIEKSSHEYINETIIDLNKREKELRNTGLFWYLLGFLSLLGGIAVALIFTNNGLEDFKTDKVNWSKTIFFAIKSIVVIILLISASKYSFNLAKSYTNESLKISDRIHAISFGKFYLQVFDQRIEPNELKDIFQNWNISNRSSFMDQKTKDFDPHILEKINELIDKVKNDNSA